MSNINDSELELKNDIKENLLLSNKLEVFDALHTIDKLLMNLEPSYWSLRTIQSIQLIKECLDESIQDNLKVKLEQLQREKYNHD